MAGNLSLGIAWDRLAQAEAVARRAGADLLPFVDSAASYSRTHARERVNGERTVRNADEFSLGLAAGYELDLWGRVRSARDAAVLDARASAEDLHAAAITLSARVASTWYELVEQYGQLDLLDRQIATNEQVLELITLRFRRGRAGAADVLQQRQLVESNRGEKAQVEADAAVLEHALAVLLGVPPEESVAERVSTLETVPPLPAPGLPGDLIRRRPDVRRAFYQVASADERVAVAIADRYPRISLSARITSSGAEATDLFRNWLATLASNLLMPVFDAGQRQAEVEYTRAAAAEAFHTYGQAVLDALAEVEDALAREDGQRNRIESLDKQLELSSQVVERIRVRYANGAVDYLRVLAVLLNQQQLQRTRLTAERELVQQRIALCRALAGGWEMRRSAPTIAGGADRGAVPQP